MRVIGGIALIFLSSCLEGLTELGATDPLSSFTLAIVSPESQSLFNDQQQVLVGDCTADMGLRLSGDIEPVLADLVCSAEGTFSIPVTLSSSDGDKTLSISLLDEAAEVLTSKSVRVVLDMTSPAAPTFASPSNSATVSSTSLAVNGSCETGSEVRLSGSFSGSPVSVACLSGSFSTAVTLTTGNGSKSLSARQTDQAGNPSSTRSISVTLNTGTTPVVPSAPTISSPANGARVGSTSLTVTGSCLTGATVNLSGNITGSGLTASCSGSAYSRAVTLTSGDGAKSIIATQTNTAGESPQVSRSVTLDTTAPAAPTVSSPSNNATLSSASFTISGSCETSAVLAISGDISGSPVSVSCSGGAFSRSLTLTGSNGSKSLSLRQTDTVGNQSNARSLALTLSVPVQTPDPGWQPMSSVRLMLSGHSLTDNPLADYLVDITAKTSDSFNYNQQIVLGSPIRVRTRGNDSNSNNWTGYSQGKNKNGGDNLNLINEIRNPQTIGSGQLYNTLVITENHASLSQIQWENTIGYFRHYHDLMVAANSANRSFFYHSWLDVNKADPSAWITHEGHAAVAWECVVSKVNQSLQAESRSDRVRLLPAGGALVDLVQRAVANQVPGITGTNTQKLNMIFSDNVHLTSLGMYYMSLVVYSSTYGKSPYGIAPPTGSGISSALAGHLQTIAWNYVENYYENLANSNRSMSSCRSYIANNTCSSYWNLLGQSNNISGCQNFFGNNGTDNPFRDAVLTPLPAP